METVLYFASFLCCRNLADDPDCKQYLPMDPLSRDLYTQCRDGILFWYGPCQPFGPWIQINSFKVVKLWLLKIKFRHATISVKASWCNTRELCTVTSIALKITLWSILCVPQCTPLAHINHTNRNLVINSRLCLFGNNVTCNVGLLKKYLPDMWRECLRIALLGPFTCCITLFSGNVTPTRPCVTLLLLELYTFVTFFFGKFDNPFALHNIWMAGLFVKNFMTFTKIKFSEKSPSYFQQAHQQVWARHDRWTNHQQTLRPRQVERLPDSREPHAGLELCPGDRMQHRQHRTRGPTCRQTTLGPRSALADHQGEACWSMFFGPFVSLIVENMCANLRKYVQILWMTQVIPNLLRGKGFVCFLTLMNGMENLYSIENM